MFAQEKPSQACLPIAKTSLTVAWSSASVWRQRTEERSPVERPWYSLGCKETDLLIPARPWGFCKEENGGSRTPSPPVVLMQSSLSEPWQCHPVSLDQHTMPTARLAAHILKDIVLGISEKDMPVPHSDIKIFKESPGTLFFHCWCQDCSP